MSINPIKKRFWLHFEGPCAREPIMCELARNTPPNFTFTIGQASMNTKMGLMGVEITGVDTDITMAVHWLKQRGVDVQPIENDVVEG